MTNISNIKRDKYIIWSLLLSINLVLSTTAIIYYNYWYIFIVVLGSASFINSVNVILICINLFTKDKKKNKNILENNINNENSINNINNINNENSINNIILPSNYIYVLPCYNETEEEINNTVKSIIKQNNIDKHTKKLIIICDGKIQRKKNNLNNKIEKRTDEILIDIIFKDSIKKKYILKNAYKTWDNKWNDLDIYTGTINNLDFIILIKTYNIGKRDSLTLLRRMIYYYNKSINCVNENHEDHVYLEYLKYLSPELLHFIENSFILDNKYNKYNKAIEYIIGTDADTILDKNCAYELLYSIKYANLNNNSKTYRNTVGVVGFVDVVKFWNPLVIYQYCEYLYAQCLKRYVQSKITFKVNCLSGCVQLIKVCNETCGNDILDIFNRLPKSNENILNHIRSYASEDRNHICIMFDMYPYVKTIQTLKAISYTHVPTTLMAFLRQRKRWSVGAACNDLLLISNSNHNMWERIQSFVNILIFSVTIFIFIATIIFIMTLIINPTYLILILASIMILPILYAILIPLIIYNDGENIETITNNKYIINNLKKLNRIGKSVGNKTSYFTSIYYYLGFILYFTLGSVLNIIVYFYTLYNIDDLNWNNKIIGKNRKITENNENENDINSYENENDINSYENENDINSYENDIYENDIYENDIYENDIYDNDNNSYEYDDNSYNDIKYYDNDNDNNNDNDNDNDTDNNNCKREYLEYIDDNPEYIDNNREYIEVIEVIAVNN